MSAWYARWVLYASFCAAVCAPACAAAEQKQLLGPYEVHYVVVPSTFFNLEIANRYHIVRGRDRGLMNISILEDGRPVAAALEGVAVNLLGQSAALEFREVREGEAIYYLAPVRYTDRETLRFRITISADDGIDHTLEFQQQMFWEDR